MLSEALTVIVTVPLPVAVTNPLTGSTVATAVFVLVHTVPSDAFDGVTVLFNCNVWPTVNVWLVGLTAKPLIDLFTTTVHCAVYPFCAIYCV